MLVVVGYNSDKVMIRDTEDNVLSVVSYAELHSLGIPIEGYNNGKVTLPLHDLNRREEVAKRILIQDGYLNTIISSQIYDNYVKVYGTLNGVSYIYDVRCDGQILGG